MLGDAYQAETNAVLLDMAQRPQPRKPPEPSFSIWSTMKAAPKGTAAGAAQGIATTAETTGAFGDVLGAMGDAGGQGMFGGLTDQDRAETNAAREKLITSGPSFNNEAGQAFRQVAKDYMPDPVTAHASEQVVANLFRVGSQAIVAAGTLGNVGGAVAVGVNEGVATSDELREKGVDLATRAKAGAATAALTSFGFALPVVGQTVKSTAGLVVAGGASNIAGIAATREILRSADYSKIADQYDPFDPTTLALSFLLPAGFGALGHATRGRAKPAKVDDASVDAARTNLLAEQIDASRLVPASDLAAAAKHSAAMARAIDQLSDGNRVDVSGIAPFEDVVTLYHGSPHEFTAFDSARIGSGEGNQAFGNGLYLAESEGVAKHYRDVLSKTSDSLGSTANSTQRDVVKSWIEGAGGDRALAERNFREFATGSLKAEEIDEIAKAIAEPSGYLYSVDIKASDLRKMLDWDKPLNQQTPEVRAAIKEFVPTTNRSGQHWPEAWEMTGGDLVKRSGDSLGGFLEADLQRAGITGVSYLDGTSRGKGDGYRNHVIFPGNEGMLRIGTRNGKRINDFSDAIAEIGRAIDELPTSIDTTPPPDTWFTGAPQEGLTATRALDEQSSRANAEGQFAGPGHYTSTSRDLAGTYGGETGRLYQVEQPFANAFDFNKVENRKSGKTRYEALVKEKGSKAGANAELRAQGYDAITFTNPRGERIANVFEARPVKDVGPARAPKKAGGELTLQAKDGPDLAPIADAVEARYPDLTVQLDGMDAPMKVSELLARIREESKLEVADSKLLETAAQCFITAG